MSTSSIHKYQKYFSASDVQTVIKSKRKHGKILPIHLYDESGNRIGLLKDGDKITVLKSDEYSYKYPVITEQGINGRVSEIFVSKPITNVGPTENLRIQTETLIKQGNDSSLSYKNASNVVCKSFTSSDQLMTSVIDGLKENWKVSDRIVETFVDYASSDYKKLNFDRLHFNEINEVGKYIGSELIPGILLLNNDHSKFSSEFVSNVKEFYVPSESYFAGVDSFISVSGSSISPISSKFGPGAKASFFSNILTEGISRYDRLEASVFKSIIDASMDVGISRRDLEERRGSKEILYEFGINGILGLGIKDTRKVYQSLRSASLAKRRLTNDARKTKQAIGLHSIPEIRKKLPHSSTSFFARETARLLGECPISMKQMKSIVADHDFIQLHLDMTKWRKGDVHFKVKRSSECDLKIIGNKGIMSDIDGRHGTVSYELR